MYVQCGNESTQNLLGLWHQQKEIEMESTIIKCTYIYTYMKQLENDTYHTSYCCYPNIQKTTYIFNQPINQPINLSIID